jgi:hypothetical protein
MSANKNPISIRERILGKMKIHVRLQAHTSTGQHQGLPGPRCNGMKHIPDLSAWQVGDLSFWDGKTTLA